MRVFLFFVYAFSAQALVEKELRADGSVLDVKKADDLTDAGPSPAGTKIENAVAAAVHESTGGKASAEVYSAATPQASAPIIRSSTTAGAVAIPFFGLLATISLIFCMLNQEADKKLALGTYKLLHHSFSLFSTVMAFMLLRKLWRLMMNNDSNQTKKVVSEVLGCCRYVFLLAAVPFALKMYFQHTQKRKFVRTLGAHLVGFAGADALSDLLKYELFSKEVGAYFGGVLMMSLIVLILVGITAVAVSKMAASCPEAQPLTAGEAEPNPEQGEGTAPAEPNPEQGEGTTPAVEGTTPAVEGTTPAVEGTTPAVEGTEQMPSAESGGASLLDEIDMILVESTGFITGFLMCSFLRYAVSRRSPAQPQVIDAMSEANIAELWATAFGFILLAIALVWKVRPMAMAPDASRMKKFALGIFIEFVAMTGSWLCFYGDQWEWWEVFAKGEAIRVEKLKAANAVGVSEAATVLVVFILIKFCKKSHWLLDVMLLNCAALCFGFGFESSIAATMADATSQSNWVDKAWTEILIICCFMMALLPPWWFFILPQAAIEMEDDATTEPMDGPKEEAQAEPTADAADAKPKDDAKAEPTAEEPKADAAEEPKADAPAEPAADAPADAEAAPAPDAKEEAAAES